MGEGFESGVLDASSVEEYGRILRRLWNIDFVQLSASRFRYRARFVATPRLTIYKERCNTPLHYRGETAPGLVAFLLPTSSRLPCSLWGHHSVRGWSLPYQTVAGELDATSGEDYSNVVLLFAADFLDATARLCGHDFEAGRLGGQGFLAADPGQSLQLRRTVSRAMTADPQRRAVSWPNVELAEDELADALLAAILPPRRVVSDPVMTGARRLEAFRACMEFAYENDFCVSIPELCAAAGTSRRALEYAFREHLDVSPARYLRLCRYRRVLTALAGSTAREDTVTRIATEWGFSDLGRFASEYRRLFGEKPSETLRRSPADVRRLPRPNAATGRPEAGL